MTEQAPIPAEVRIIRNEPIIIRRSWSPDTGLEPILLPSQNTSVAHVDTPPSSIPHTFDVYVGEKHHNGEQPSERSSEMPLLKVVRNIVRLPRRLTS